MPNYPPTCELRLAAEAYASWDETPVQFHFLGFWEGFYKPPESSLRTLIKALFSGIGLRKVYIVSVFGPPSLYNNDIPALRRSETEPGVKWVSYSGEPRALPWADYDVNLIMEPEQLEKRIVSVPNFITNAIELGLFQSLMRPRVPYCPDKKRFCAFVVRNGNNPVRNEFVRRLNREYKRVDCAGPWMNNMPGGKTAPEDSAVYGDAYLPFLMQYKFVICFENCAQPANLTEKLLNAWMAGCIPIYWGCPGVLEWLNPKAFLYLDDIKNSDLLIQKIKELDENPVAYLEMFKEPLIHPSKGIPDGWTLEGLRRRVQGCLSA
jgi:alpha(1,3/1,4) fucosyltransferase